MGTWLCVQFVWNETFTTNIFTGLPNLDLLNFMPSLSEWAPWGDRKALWSHWPQQITTFTGRVFLNFRVTGHYISKNLKSPFLAEFLISASLCQWRREFHDSLFLFWIPSPVHSCMQHIWLSLLCSHIQHLWDDTYLFLFAMFLWGIGPDTSLLALLERYIQCLSNHPRML